MVLEAVANLEMALSTLQETIMVTGEAPLLDVTKSSLGGNVDPKQMESIPVSGRNRVPSPAASKSAFID